MKVKTILLSVCLLAAMVIGTGCDSSSSSGGSSGSICQYDGCTNKAVGPTYEFCSYHKKC
ncbi:MAG: hypothetical protein LUF89_03845 [Ruminococcus sp.]|nr:hypothetical protein [Ruminococcus sp.]